MREYDYNYIYCDTSLHVGISGPQPRGCLTLPMSLAPPT